MMLSLTYGYLSNMTWRVSFSFIFLGLPIFTKIPPLATRTPVEHTNFQANCEAEGFPRPVVNWTRLVMPLPAGKAKVKERTLTVKNLSPDDSGYYVCVASNVMGIKKVRIGLVVQKQQLGTSLVQMW